MKKNLIKMMAVLTASMALSSCLSSDDNDLTYTMAYSNFFNVVKEISSGNTYYYTGVGYAITYNTTKMTADVTLSGVTLPSGALTNLEFDNLALTITENGWNKIQATNVTPTSLTTAPVFNSLTLNIVNRYVLTNSLYPCINIQYLINNTYQIYSFPAAVINVGTTTAIDQDGNAFTTSSSDEATVAVQFNVTGTTLNLNLAEQRTANINLYDAQFASDMEAVNLVIPDLNWNASGSMIQLSADGPIQLQQINSSTSTLSDYEDYKVTNISCLTDASNSMSLTYTVSSESKGVTYKVSTLCSGIQ